MVVGGEERNDGRYNNDNDAMTMNDDNAAFAIATTILKVTINLLW